MKEKQEILIRYINKGESIRHIARDMKIHRKTIRRYIDQYSHAQQELLFSGKIERGEHIKEFIDPPSYDTSNRVRRKATIEIVEKVKYFLEENRKKRSRGQRKQQMKKIDMFEILQDEGFDIGYTTVCNLVNELEDKGSESFLKQSYSLGDVCEFDWGEVKIFINGKLEIFQLSVFTSAAGNYRYGRLFKKQDTSSFQSSHAHFFNKIGGAYKTMVYDNMRVAVKRFVGFNEKEATDGLLKLSIYYNFNFRFCNIRKGNEKGHVERSVEYIRRKAFSYNDHFNTLDEANSYLETICDKLNNIPQAIKKNQNAMEILSQEKPFLLPSKPFFDCAILERVVVDKYSTICFKTCHYSVPCKYVGKVMTLKAYPQKVIICFNDKYVCEHLRLFGKFEWTLNINHYTKTLKRKPGALHGSLALKQVDSKLKDIYQKYYIDNPKDFIDLLDYMKNSSLSINDIGIAITELESINSDYIDTAKIKIICDKKYKKEKTYLIPADNSEIENNCKLHLESISSLFNNSDNLNSNMEVLL